MNLLNEATIQKELQILQNWKYIDYAIEKSFVFKNFSETLGFLVQVGVKAEKLNHHPEIHNIYNKVKLRLTTHDADGVTQKDIDLAIAIDQVV